MPECFTKFVGVMLDYFTEAIEDEDERTRIRKNMQTQLEVNDARSLTIKNVFTMQ